MPIFLLLGIMARHKKPDRIHMVVITSVIVAVIMVGEGLLLRGAGFIRHDSMYSFLPILSFMLFTIIVSLDERRLLKIRSSIRNSIDKSLLVRFITRYKLSFITLGVCILFIPLCNRGN